MKALKITGFAGICKNIENDVVNIDFICAYLSGSLTTSDESLEVKWFKREDALKGVTFPLTKKRLRNMLSCVDKMYCFGFRREPFDVVVDDFFKIG